MKILIEVPIPSWYEDHGSELLITALVMSFLSLILVLNRYRIGLAKSKGRSSDQLAVGTQQLKSELPADIRDEIRRLVREYQPLSTPVPIAVAKVAEEIAPTRSWEQIENRIPVAPLAPSAPVAIKCYAKFPADEQSFSSDMLVQSQDGEQVYELDLLGDSGTYKVSESEAVQRYALSEDKYLLACAYDELPLNRNVRIINQQTGILSRRGKDWHIDQKVYIKFS